MFISLKFVRIAAAAMVFILGSWMSVGPVQAATPAPLGYQLMCLKTPTACKGGGVATMSLSASDMAILKRVNSAVNGSIVPRPDAPGADVWTVGAKTGDCEEFAIAKRQSLIKLGFAPSALRLAYVKTRSGEGHAVLIIKSAIGDLVLDNLTSTIKPLSQSGLRLISMASANPLKWI
jgi:predicted transglutaminase-like cysteine proteinase